MEHTEKKEKSSKQKIAKLDKQIANLEGSLKAVNAKRQKVKESFDEKIQHLKQEQTKKLSEKDEEIAKLSNEIAQLEQEKEAEQFQEIFRSVKEQGFTADALLSAVQSSDFLNAVRDRFVTGGISEMNSESPATEEETIFPDEEDEEEYEDEESILPDESDEASENDEMLNPAVSE